MHTQTAAQQLEKDLAENFAIASTNNSLLFNANHNSYSSLNLAYNVMTVSGLWDTSCAKTTWYNANIIMLGLWCVLDSHVGIGPHRAGATYGHSHIIKQAKEMDNTCAAREFGTGVCVCALLLPVGVALHNEIERCAKTERMRARSIGRYRHEA